jgi:hypothetical protein
MSLRAVGRIHGGWYPKADSGVIDSASREETMRPPNWKTVSTLVTMLVIAGCNDAGISSPPTSQATSVSMMLAPDGAPTLSLTGTAADNLSADFTVTPAGGTFAIGNHAVVFPANSICDPATSSYGPGTWDDDCTPASGAIAIHAEVKTSTVGTWIDFTPALRFVASRNPHDYVWIVMNTPTAIGATDLSKFGIFYAAALGAPAVNDSPNDPSSRTFVDTYRGITTRRIKHFSGWYNSSGRSCDPAVDEDCSEQKDAITGP